MKAEEEVALSQLDGDGGGGGCGAVGMCSHDGFFGITTTLQMSSIGKFLFCLKDENGFSDERRDTNPE